MEVITGSVGLPIFRSGTVASERASPLGGGSECVLLQIHGRKRGRPRFAPVAKFLFQMCMLRCQTGQVGFQMDDVDFHLTGPLHIEASET